MIETISDCGRCPLTDSVVASCGRSGVSWPKSRAQAEATPGPSDSSLGGSQPSGSHSDRGRVLQGPLRRDVQQYSILFSYGVIDIGVDCANQSRPRHRAQLCIS